MNIKCLFIAASCIYLAGYQGYSFLKYFSPACIALLFFFPVTIFALGRSRFNAVPAMSIAYAGATFLIVCWQQKFLDCYNSFLDSTTNLVMSTLFFSIAWILFSREPKSTLIQGLQLALKCLLTILVVDTVWRMAIPLYQGVSFMHIYSFKTNTPFFPDSNFHCANCLVMLELSYYLEKHTSLSYSHQRVATVVLSLLTFSRALIIGVVLYYVCRYIFLSLKKGNVILLASVTATAYVAMVYSLPTIEADGSYQTKIEIIEAVQQISSSESYNCIVGIGDGNYKRYSESEYNRMRACHNLLGFIVEMGALWSLLTLLWWIGIYRITKGFLRVLAIPLLTIFLVSLYPTTFLGPVYMIIALVGIIELQSESERIALRRRQLSREKIPSLSE